jgi:hypothetical protein
MSYRSSSLRVILALSIVAAGMLSACDLGGESATPIPPTETPIPSTSTPIPPTNTPADTPIPPTNTPIPSTSTPIPPTNTPTDTPIPPTNTPTETPIPIEPVYIYKDYRALENLFVPEGFMGDVGNIVMDEQITENPYSGETAIQIIYTPGGANEWGGIYWWNPPGGDWCDIPGELDLTGATKLTFWARGENGGERAEFKVGGLRTADSEPCDSLRTPRTTRYFALETEWTQYEIDLTGADLSQMSSGFVWVTNATVATIIYLDEIRFE